MLPLLHCNDLWKQQYAMECYYVCRFPSAIFLSFCSSEVSKSYLNISTTRKNYQKRFLHIKVLEQTFTQKLISTF